MGSFNVACSISNISIDYGVEIRFIPLLPNVYEDNQPHVIGRSSLMYYSNDLFNPATLPIKGIYGDYGGIDKIVKDQNTLSIENRYGLSIEDFISILTENRGINDSNGKMFECFASNKSRIYDYKESTKESMNKLGFEVITHNNEEFFVHNVYSDWKVQIEKEESKFFIYNKDYELKEESILNSIDYQLLNTLYKVSGLHFNVNEEDQWKVNELQRMSGMFVIEKIFQAMIIPNEEIQGWSYSKESFEESYGHLLNEIKKFEEEKDNADEILMKYNNPTGVFGRDRFTVLSYFKNWKLFSPLYDKFLNDNEIRDLITDYYYFSRSMVNMNRFYFPAMNGTQDGNQYATKLLLEESLKIVNERIADYE